MTDSLESNVERLMKAWADPLDEPRVDELTERFLSRLGKPVREKRVWGRIAMAASLGVCAWILWIVVSQSEKPAERPVKESEKPRPVAPSPVTHVVMPGDTIWLVARKCYGRADASLCRLILEANPGITEDGLAVGQKLFIPAPPQEKEDKTWPKRHVVEEGETYASISQKYYGDDSHWKLLVDANPDVNPFRLTKGQILIVPRKSVREPQVVQVKTAEEFLDAIASDITIEVAPGTYNLSKVRQKKMDFVVWEEETDGPQVKIRNVKNLTIRGSKEDPPSILTEPRYGWVLRFENAANVTLENLVLGHTLKGYCSGGVVEWSSCKNVAIEGCDLFGCGTEGMHLERVTGLRFANSRIRDCTYGIMTISESAKVEFVDSRFENNREYYGFLIGDSSDIEFRGCTIARNEVSDPLFKVTSSSRIKIKGSTILDNDAERLAVGPLDLEETAVRENTFRKE